MDLVLVGLDATNSLGFLAAVGTLVVSSRKHKSWLRWDRTTPVIRCDVPSAADWLRDLSQVVRIPNLDIPDHVRVALKDTVESPECATGRVGEAKKASRFKSTEANGASKRSWSVLQNDVFAAMAYDSRRGRSMSIDMGARNSEVDRKCMSQLILTRSAEWGPSVTKFADISANHVRLERLLQSSLMQPWKYEERVAAMCWDSVDTRGAEKAGRFGFCLNDDESSQVSMIGANLLAIEALPMFPVVARGGKGHTTGFTRLNGVDVFTWGLWSHFATQDVVRSLIGLPQLHVEHPDSQQLASFGVHSAYRSIKKRYGKYYRLLQPMRVA